MVPASQWLPVPAVPQLPGPAVLAQIAVFAQPAVLAQIVLPVCHRTRRFTPISVIELPALYGVCVIGFNRLFPESSAGYDCILTIIDRGDINRATHTEY